MPRPGGPVFVCYAREDQDFVLQLVTNLKTRGADLWVDQQDIPAGANWDRTIDETLDTCSSLLMVLSPAAVASREVQGELRTALDADRDIIPVLLRECRIPRALRAIQRVDATSGDPTDETVLDRIAQALQASLAPPSPAADVVTSRGQRPTDAPQETRFGGIELVEIPAGSFMMGSPDSEEGRFDDEGPQHRVTVRAFRMGRDLVTNQEYARVSGVYPQLERSVWHDDPAFSQPKQPVVGISWAAAREFARLVGGRLPTEAEWEYAARADTTAPYLTGTTLEDVDRFAWYSENSEGRLHDVGEKAPNRWGLHDVLGNAWEWVTDDWHDSHRGAPADGSARVHTPRGSRRVLKGGSFGSRARSVRAARRYGFTPHPRDLVCGFRVVVA